MSADVHILKISVPKFIRDTITFNVGRNWYKGRLNYYKKNELLDEEIVQYIKSDIKQISIFDDDYYIFIRDALLCLDTKYSKGADTGGYNLRKEMLEYMISQYPTRDYDIGIFYPMDSNMIAIVNKYLKAHNEPEIYYKRSKRYFYAYQVI